MLPKQQTDTRNNLKLGSKCQIYSNSKKKWLSGEIIKIYHTKTDGEYLTIKYLDGYDEYIKDITRFSNNIRMINNSSKGATIGDTITNNKDKQTQPQSIVDDRINLKPGSKCQIYSHSKKKWANACVMTIFSDNEGEWLKMWYVDENNYALTKDMKRYSNNIRMIHAPSESDDDTLPCGWKVNDDKKNDYDVDDFQFFKDKVLKWMDSMDKTIINLQRKVERLEKNTKNKINAIAVSSKEEEIIKLLKRLSMEEYFDKFIDDGYDELDVVIEMNVSELIDIGISKKGHRKKLLSEFAKLKNDQYIEKNEGIIKPYYTNC